MPCISPLDGWLSKERTESGKRMVVFRLQDGLHDRPVTVPCGRCRGCRLEKSRQWAMRCMHEASLYDENCFLTLTYDDAHLPENGSLAKVDFQRFMKRLRWRYRGRSIRFYHCGEYGDESGRPHYHALLFGFDFDDKVRWSVRNGNEVWRSDALEELWPYGHSEIGTVTFESAAYVARYVMKKFVSSDEEAVKAYYGCREPEYATMSRRPGIGREWFELYGDEVYAHDSVIVNGREVKPPKFYDALFEAVSPGRLAEVKAKRRRGVVESEQASSRLLAKSKVLEARISLYEEGELNG